MNPCDFNLPSLSIIRITKEDVSRLTDTARIFSQLVTENEPMYPDIQRWLKKKVFPGIRNDSRGAFLALSDGMPIATAVVKRGSNAKFCHLRLAEEFRDKSLGEILFVFMAFEVRNWAREIHFTLPESLWENEQQFFKSFGFTNVSRLGVQYRLFDQELVCSATFVEVWSHVLEKLPKLRRLFSFSEFSLVPRLLLSIKPKFAYSIISGEKTVELRTRFSRRWAGHRVSIYASGNMRGLLGEATIRQVDAGDPSVIWLRYGSNLGCSQKEFLKYVEGRSEVYAIELTDVTPYMAPIPIVQVEHLSKQTLTPPQSYLELHDDSPWARAVSIAGLLQGGGGRRF
jgi:predicted transcriptional regulator